MFNVDQWVIERIIQYGYQVIVPPPAPKKRKLGNVYNFGTFIHNGHDESLSNWEIISTIGDGSCLIHSFLLLKSPAYNQLNHINRVTIGQTFRRFLSRNIPNLEQREIDGEIGFFINNIVYKEVFNNLKSDKKLNVIDKIKKKYFKNN